MDDELRCYIESIEKRFEALREADREAVRLAHADLSRRLEGFPQQFATKEEMDSAGRALQRLEKDSISREIYEQNHRVLRDMVSKMEQDKMPSEVFSTFVQNYRIEQERAAEERRAVASALAASTARSAGGRATWGQIGAVLGGIVAVLTIVVILVNWAFPG